MDMFANGEKDEEGRHRKRKFDLALALPVILVVAIISTLWCIFTFVHCLPLIQESSSQSSRNDGVRTMGIVEMSVFQFITAMLLWCYILAIVIPPGDVPDSPEWIAPGVEADGSQKPAETLETKKSGERRHCKWCDRYKPDRCHHCRLCRKCIMKMDHHCPWIYNCVGYYNYKPFFLLLLYSTIACHFISLCMFRSVKRFVVDDESDFNRMFLLLFGETLASFMGVFVSGFFAFHIWLGSRNMTTIEFCEKNTRGRNLSGGHGSGVAKYDRGCTRNLVDMLGPNPWLWLVPIGARAGDGLNFPAEESPLLPQRSEKKRGGPSSRSRSGNSDVGRSRSRSVRSTTPNTDSNQRSISGTPAGVTTPPNV